MCSQVTYKKKYNSRATSGFAKVRWWLVLLCIRYPIVNLYTPKQNGCVKIHNDRSRIKLFMINLFSPLKSQTAAKFAVISKRTPHQAIDLDYAYVTNIKNCAYVILEVYFKIGYWRWFIVIKSGNDPFPSQFLENRLFLGWITAVYFGIVLIKLCWETWDQIRMLLR